MQKNKFKARSNFTSKRDEGSAKLSATLTVRATGVLSALATLEWYIPKLKNSIILREHTVKQDIGKVVQKQRSRNKGISR